MGRGFTSNKVKMGLAIWRRVFHALTPSLAHCGSRTAASPSRGIEVPFVGEAVVMCEPAVWKLC